MGSGAIFCRCVQDFIFTETEYLPQLAGNPVRLGRGEVDLVDHRNQIQVVLHGQERVGDGLSFDALAGIDYQQRTFAGGQGAGNLIAEIHMPGGVDQV